MEETEVPGEKPQTYHKSLTNVVSRTPLHEWDSNSQLLVVIDRLIVYPTITRSRRPSTCIQQLYHVFDTCTCSTTLTCDCVEK